MEDGIGLLHAARLCGQQEVGVTPGTFSLSEECMHLCLQRGSCRTFFRNDLYAPRLCPLALSALLAVLC